MDAAIAMPRIFHEVEMLNDAVNTVEALRTQLVKLILAQIDVGHVRHVRKRRRLQSNIGQQDTFTSANAVTCDTTELTVEDGTRPSG